MPSSFKRIPSTLWYLPFLLALEVSLYIALSVLLSHLLYLLHARNEPLAFDWRIYISIVWRGLLFIMFSTGYYFLISNTQKRKQEIEKALEVEQLKLDLAKAERDFLRSQINPHLLFNTLNFVKYAAKNQPDQADDAIIRLSEIMSFAMGKSAGGFIELRDELKQVENIIRLNQLRFGNNLHINYTVQMNNEKSLILPIILLTLVENIFKHGNLTDADFAASIKVESTVEYLMFKTCNLPRNGGEILFNSLGTGLNNIEMRLLNNYKDKFSFEYGMEGNFYKTQLQMPIQPSKQILDSHLT